VIRLLLPAVLAAAGLVGCAGVASPARYPDTLFVIMKDQADLSDLVFFGTDVAARRAETYRRLVALADRSQAALRRDLTRLFLPFTPFYLVNAVEVAGDPATGAWLARRPDVDRVLLNPTLPAIPPHVDPLARVSAVDGGPQPNIRAIGADKVWATGITGTGVVIGIADSGADGRHPVLRGAFRGSDDSWYDPWNGSRFPADDSGHGTHVLGSAVGTNGIGVAPGARWIGCVDLPRDLGDPASYLRCLQFMLAPFPYGGDPLRDGRPDRAADILINSWSCATPNGCDVDALQPAIRALTRAGIFVIAATAVGGPACGGFGVPPIRYPETFTVGAATLSGAVAEFANRGPGQTGRAARGLPGPDLVAPGVDVLSALPGGGYGTMTGTAMAAPHVAGTVALLWQANPRLVGDIIRTRDLLTRTATTVPGSAGCGDEAGAGFVNAQIAVNEAVVA
jgi:subtilisin family serine protease